jgi:hypothetical protein
VTITEVRGVGGVLFIARRYLGSLARTTPQAAGLTVGLLFSLLGWHLPAHAAQLTATWMDDSPNALGFSVERSSGPTGSFAQIATTPTGVMSYVDPSVVDGTTYCYRVRAYNAVEYSSYSNVACATAGTTPTFSLSVVKAGMGSGTATSTPTGIVCGTSCSASYAGGTVVVLTAVAATGSTFTGWSGGGCSGTSTCSVTLTATTTVTADFETQPTAQPATLTVSLWGRGMVTSAPVGIACGRTCSASFPSGMAVTLTATARGDFRFVGWSGGCVGSGSCTLTLTSPTAVTAIFAGGN